MVIWLRHSCNWQFATHLHIYLGGMSGIFLLAFQHNLKHILTGYWRPQNSIKMQVKIVVS